MAYAQESTPVGRKTEGSRGGRPTGDPPELSAISSSPTGQPDSEDDGGMAMVVDTACGDAGVPRIGTITLSAKARGKMRATTPRSWEQQQAQASASGQAHAMTSLAEFSARNMATLTTPKSEADKADVNAWLHEQVGASSQGGFNYDAVELPPSRPSSSLFIGTRLTTLNPYAPSDSGSMVYASAMESHPVVDTNLNDTPEEAVTPPARGRSETVREASHSGNLANGMRAHNDEGSIQQATSSPSRSCGLNSVQMESAGTPSAQGGEAGDALFSDGIPNSHTGTAMVSSRKNSRDESHVDRLSQGRGGDAILEEMAHLRGEVLKLREELQAVKTLLDVRSPAGGSVEHGADSDRGAGRPVEPASTHTDPTIPVETPGAPKVEVRRQGQVVTVVFH
ncbi:uncharacterized protein TRAVEDRAFT_22744 [Trametes versicolor FP-101664 SS1]|uniref:uncharacterized protein n=1 Tax=Trametes versicolor (strain FP-101664) TaxID=717944 RepID=UPI0004622DC8|nr:uncharacterized protein TRAVEDRAFT_22744 [Trametes versicolor FP-101664 SS1]EIW54893.1 hypothetical protein TRAVEDRAFT_22744 [Trametes versicolor FP-101664 SS1]